MKAVTDRNRQLLDNLTEIYNAGLKVATCRTNVALRKDALDTYTNMRYFTLYSSPNKMSERAIDAFIKTEEAYKAHTKALLLAEKTLRKAEIVYECHKREHAVLINLPANYKTKGK